MEQLRLGFMCSHGGSVMQAIVDACRQGRLSAEPCVVISNNSGAFALARASREGIPTCHLSAKQHPEPAGLDRAISDTLARHGVNLVVLAGYMKPLGPTTLARFPGRVLNTHPALLPRFGGKGMYGRLVHEAVLSAGERVTGVTIHLVDEEYDHGPVVARCEVPVLDGDTVDSLMKRVQGRERELYVETLRGIAAGEIVLKAGQA